MEKRVFLAIFLSFIVLVVWQTTMSPPPPPQKPAATATPAPGVAATSPTPTSTPPGAATAQPAGKPAAADPATPAATPAEPGAKPLVSDAAERDIVVETESVIATFSSRGGVLKSYRLRQYSGPDGKPLELIPVDLGEAHQKPFTLVTDDAKESATLAAALYQPSVESLSLGTSTGALTFNYRDDSGLDARKTFSFQRDGQAYVIVADAAVSVAGAPRPVSIAFGPGIGPGYSQNGSTFTAPRAIHWINGDVERLAASDLQTRGRYEGQLRFAGADEAYFLSVALMPTGESQVDYTPVSAPIPGDTAGGMRSFISYSVRPKSPGGGTPTSVSVPFFIGPKDFDRLRAADPQLVYAIDFGMFSWMVVPLLQALKGINRYLGNYGWSIIVLTVFINILIFPLRHRSMVSMKKMQAIQPEMKAIQERYAKFKVTDPERQKMNQEMMALYKSKGVNPASGCVPLLLTMPILLAFYSLLSQAIELRGAPFLGWIHDLSAKDPTYIFPVLMGATMFWQQRMMPSTADPMQQKIFLFLPIMFTFLFLSMPSGLVIYWMVSNLLTIAQQFLTNRIIGTPAVARVSSAQRKA